MSVSSLLSGISYAGVACAATGMFCWFFIVVLVLVEVCWCVGRLFVFYS